MANLFDGSNESNLAVGCIAIAILVVIALVVVVPLLAIWSLNVLFGLGIAYSLKTWFAALVLTSIVGGSKGYYSRNK